MKCVMFGGKTEEKQAEYKEFGVLFGKFKADVCTKCGETYFNEKIAEAIQQKSRELGFFGMVNK